MPLSRDIMHVLATTADLINSIPDVGGIEQLADLPALREFIALHLVTEVDEPTLADLHGVHDLRRRLHAVFLANDEAAAMDRVNYLLAAAPVRPRLANHDGLGVHLHYFPPFAPIADHLGADCAMALAQLIVAGEVERLRVCASPTCSRVLIDSSRNRSRLYCDSQSCGNRLHAAAYRARQREAANTS